jgi:phosphoglycolate/pyridoxal phosphate phosphatase family enzyme
LGNEMQLYVYVLLLYSYRILLFPFSVDALCLNPSGKKKRRTIIIITILFIYQGDSLIDGIPETLEKLRKAGKKMFFVTNNSTKSRAGYKKKFDGLGLTDVPAEEIFSSSFAAAAYLEQSNFPTDGSKKVYVIGEVGICEELDLIGIPHLGGPADSDKVANMGSGGRLEVDPDVGAVIVGFDRDVNYYKIQYAQLCINEGDAEFIATNLDAVTHLTDAQEWAGNGSMVGAIRGCTGQEPTVVGKPSPLMIEYLESKYGMDRSRICMVGDRLDTDVLFGTDNGLKSLLVLSGVTSEEKLLSPDNSITPDFYADDINAFFATEAVTV